MKTLLSVNVDHVATLRQARGSSYPSPLEAAKLALDAGASGITVHLRGDRRHIQETDIVELRQAVDAKLNLEMAATREMVEVALEVRPDQVTLVPERPDEVTTEGGLDLLRHGDRVLETASRLTAGGISVSLFLDPDRDQLLWLIGQASNVIRGFEINTDRYSSSDSSGAEAESANIRQIATEGSSAGLGIYAGHGLTTANVGQIAAVEPIEELNIGHFLISRAVLVGLAQAVKEMLAEIASANPAD